jgi:hypothetical protein
VSEDLDELERAVLEMLLAGDHPTLATLRAQAARVRVAARKLSGVGFFTDFEVPADLRTVSHPRDFEIGDVDGDLEGLARGAAFVVFIRKGRLDFLEAHTYGEPWPEQLGAFRLRYREEPRDLRGIEPPSRP